jgi:hypothetical protein
MELEGSLPCAQEPATCLDPEPEQSSPQSSHPITLRSILILSIYLHLVCPSCLFTSGFLTKILYVFLFSPMRATRPTHLNLLDLIMRKILGEGYKSGSCSLCSILQNPVSSCLSDQNIFLSIEIYYILRLCPSLNMRNQYIIIILL